MFPQSGERFEGLENFREWRRIYPATKAEFDIRRVRGHDDVWEPPEWRSQWWAAPPHPPSAASESA
jgi:hypothetical protein